MSTQGIKNHYYNVLSTKIEAIQGNKETNNRYKLAAICRLVNTVDTYYGQHMMAYINCSDLDAGLEKYDTDKFIQVYPFPYRKNQ